VRGIAVLTRPSLQPWVAALSVAVVLTVSFGARAQDPAGAPKHADDPMAAEARRHYEEGTKAFNLGEFPRAITEFKAAYNAKADPSLLYNIAQSYRLQGDAAQAVFFYKSFLRNMPAAPNRKEVEGRIRTLDKQVEEQRKEPVPLVPPPAVTSPPPAAPAVVGTAPAISPVPPATTERTPLTPGSAVGDVAAPKAPETPPPSTVPPTLEPQPVAAPPATVDLTSPPPEATPATPVYKKWWFWTGIGAVVLVGVVAVAARDKPPSTTFGLFDPTFTKP